MGTFHSPSVDTTTSGAGAYHWIAHYSGDANNEKADGACLATNENTTVNKAGPGLATQVNAATATVGASISDAATLTGLISPSGGTVTFDLYKGADCSAANKVGATLNATDNPVAANGTFHSPSVDTTTSGAGYHWIAHYSGDANNQKADGACLATNENTTVNKAGPGLATQVNAATATVGASISDAATLTGLISPSGGTVTFDLYKGADCSAANKVGATLNATDNPVAANGTFHSPSVDTTTSGAGAYHWIAHSSATPTTKKPTAPASPPTRTRPSTKAAPASRPRSTPPPPPSAPRSLTPPPSPG